MRRWIKVVLVLLASLLLAGWIGFMLLDADLPRSEPGAAAEALADKMLGAVNAEAWDSTGTVSWVFAGRQRYVWKREVDSVSVAWGDVQVDLHTETITGRAFRKGVPVEGPDAEGLIAQAWAHFCNDSFWLAAPFKIRDPGTTRGIVKTEDGRDALLVSYASGGVTPGDAYLWELDEEGLPQSYRMWVGIIPIGGLKATWEQWQTLPSGARIATRHEIGPVALELPVEELSR